MISSEWNNDNHREVLDCVQLCLFFGREKTKDVRWREFWPESVIPLETIHPASVPAV